MALCNVWRFAIVWSFDACDILNCSCQGLLYFMKYIFVGHWTLETLHHKLICNQIVLICWRLFYHLNQFDIPSKCQIVYLSQKFLLKIFYWIELTMKQHIIDVEKLTGTFNTCLQNVLVSVPYSASSKCND